jgi:hypothetical protein
MQHERERSAERTRTGKDGHASVTVTAHTYADLFDDELHNIAAALDSLDDVDQGPEQTRQRGDDTFGPTLAPSPSRIPGFVVEDRDEIAR